jgi:prophage regulatory protein
MRDTDIRLPTSVSEVQAAEFLRLASVVHRTGLARSTIYRLMAEHQFPSPVKLTARAVGWRRSDLDRWSEARPPGR